LSVFIEDCFISNICSDKAIHAKKEKNVNIKPRILIIELLLLKGYYDSFSVLF